MISRDSLLSFLKGEEPLDGVWFGEDHPNIPGQFWWRQYIDLFFPKDEKRGIRNGGLTKETLMQRIKIDQNGCWNWTGRITKSNGRASVSFKGKHWIGHRLFYTLFKAEIPDGLVLDHLCRNPLCMNPDHLEPVTNEENVRRGYSPHAVNWRKTHCINGHEFNEENTHTTKNGRRKCRSCDAERHKNAYQARIASANQSA